MEAWMPEQTVKLSRRYEAHGKVFDTVALATPKLRHYLAVGDPVELPPGPDGAGQFVVKHLDRIAAYVDRLAVPEKPGRECLDDLDLVDSIALSEAVTDFFMEARRRLGKPMNSSSGQDSPST
jgi:hypothetical protein